MERGKEESGKGRGKTECGKGECGQPNRHNHTPNGCIGDGRSRISVVGVEDGVTRGRGGGCPPVEFRNGVGWGPPCSRIGGQEGVTRERGWCVSSRGGLVGSVGWRG